MLAQSAALHLGTPPLAAEAEGLTAAEVLARYPPRQVHYGHVRVRINYPYRYPYPYPYPCPYP